LKSKFDDLVLNEELNECKKKFKNHFQSIEKDVFASGFTDGEVRNILFGLERHYKLIVETLERHQIEQNEIDEVSFTDCGVGYR
jgi:DNA-binding ferritin-like protein (Dps family)